MRYMTIAMLAIVFLIVSQPIAQVMVIHKSDGSNVRIPVSSINKITFSLSGAGILERSTAFHKIKAVMAHILPNPFGTRIEYSLDKPGKVMIRAFDLQGKCVRTISNSFKAVGSFFEVWNSTDDAGKVVANGPYLLTVEINGKTYSQTLFIVK
jgi:hypothetical protein